MSKVKLTGQKTPLLPLSWVSVRGDGKLKKDAEDNKEPQNYIYCATVTMSKAQAETIKKTLDKFWRENKPAGVGKQKYDVVKEEFIKKLDAEGKPMLDEDDEPIKEATGNYTMMAKSLTVWPDGKPNVIKLLGSNGKELMEGHPLENGCGQGTEGIIHYSVGINGWDSNEGLQIYLNGVQIKESTFTEYTGGDADIHAEAIEDDVADADVEDGPKV
jgi:hypothetical protein